MRPGGWFCYRIFSVERKLINLFFGCFSRELVFNPKHRDHCAVECENMDSGKIFTRGRIASLIEFARDGFPFIFRVWCYDIGEYVNRTPNQLYQIPEEFMKIPETTVSVILADIKPFGNEEKFRKHKLPNRGSENYQKDEILVGRVMFQLRIQWQCSNDFDLYFRKLIINRKYFFI